MPLMICRRPTVNPPPGLNVMNKIRFNIISCLTLAVSACVVLPSCTTISGQNSILVREAKTWEGRHYKKGVNAQCANWVTTVVSKTGKTPPAGSSAARSWMSWGKSVPVSQVKAGDVLVLKNTYKPGPSHVGTYVGDGEFMHRSTHGKPVKLTQVSKYQVASVRRL